MWWAKETYGNGRLTAVLTMAIHDDSRSDAPAPDDNNLCSKCKESAFRSISSTTGRLRSKCNEE